MCVWTDAHTVWPHSQIRFSWLCSQRSGYCCVVTISFLKQKGRIHWLSSCISLIFRMAMNLCSVLHLPSPDVSFGHSLEGRRGLCVIFTSNTQISFFVEVDFYNSGIRKTCWLFKSLFFSFSSLSPILHSRVGSLSICVSLHEWARVSWILPGYLLFATFVSGLWNWRRTGMIIWDVISETIYASGSIGSRAIMQPFSPSRSPFLFPSLSGCLFDGSFFFSSYFPFTVSLRSK